MEDFSAAVRSVSDARPFERAARSAIRWRSEGFAGQPPFVAHLAMTVLAVTEDPLGGSNGVYRRQNQLLGLPADAIAPPGYGEHVPQLWAVWNDWLDGPGSRFGSRTARTHGRWTLQGWARSQGLIRHGDRVQIEAFLADVDPGRRRRPSTGELTAWLGYRGGPGHEFLARFRDEAAQEILAMAFAEEIKRWHAEGPRPSREVRRRPRALLHHDDLTDVFSGLVEVDPAWHGVALDVGEDEPRIPDSFDSVLFVTPRASVEDLLDVGVTHRMADGLVVRFGGEDRYVMRDDPDTSGRVQCRDVIGVTDVHVLVRAGRVSELAEPLRRPTRKSGRSRSRPDAVPTSLFSASPTFPPGSACGRTSRPAGEPGRRWDTCCATRR